MRLPKVGESGWQAMSIVGRWDGWLDVEIVREVGIAEASIFSPKHFAKGGPWFLVDHSVGRTISSVSTLRRKPEQKDNQAAE